MMEQQQQDLSLPLLSQVKKERRVQRKRLREELRQHQQRQQRQDQQQQGEQNITKQYHHHPSSWDSYYYHPWKNRNTIELGAGLGMVSLVTCLMGATSIATDGDETVLDHARWNFLQNLKQDNDNHQPTLSWIPCNQPTDKESSSTGGRVKTKTFLWGDRLKAKELLHSLANISKQQQQDPENVVSTTTTNEKSDNTHSRKHGKNDGNDVFVDFVLAADVVYGYDKDDGHKRQDTFSALVQSFLDLSSTSTLIVLAYKPRRPSERFFFQLMEQHFEGAPLDRKLLHPDFSSNSESNMNVYFFRLKERNKTKYDGVV